MTDAERVKLIIAQAQLEDAASAIAAEIKDVREEGRREGMMEAAQIVRGLQHPMPLNTIQESFINMVRFATNRAADAIEAKAKEG